MEEHVSDVPEGLDAATLTPIVERVLDEQELRITAWRCTRLHGGNAGSVFRLGGDAETQSRSTPWSVVLKIPSREVSPVDPSGGTHEPVIYRSMFLRELPACLAAPRCFGVVEQPSGQHWLWLEDVPHSSVSWGWDCYADVARRLGQFNGTFLVGRPSPPGPGSEQQARSMTMWRGCGRAQTNCVTPSRCGTAEASYRRTPRISCSACMPNARYSWSNWIGCQ